MTLVAHTNKTTIGILVSSVQKELSDERRSIREFIHNEALRS